MSWSVNAEGTHDAVMVKIEADPNVPQTVKDSTGHILGLFSPDKAVTVSTHGHHDAAGGGNATITVTTTN